MKTKMKIAHMKVARIYSELSHCMRRKVGCVIVKELEQGLSNIVSIGYNGTGSGEDNACEDCDGLTKPNVIHAEDNALKKLHYRAQNLHLFVTYEPCILCADKIIASGITHVYYSVNREEGTYGGIAVLNDNGVVVEHLQI